jgi:glucokinase
VPDRQHPEDYFAGIDVSGANMRAVVVSFDGEVVERREHPRQPQDLVPQIAQLASALREVKPIKSVGVGIPALVNRDTDRVLISAGLPAAVSGDIHSELMKATGLRFELENDANAAAYGEYKAGAGRDANDLFYIGIGDWIGGAIILGGRLWIGASGCAGEVGHITIDTDGIECVCGNTGCLETVAAAPNIVRRAQDRLDRDSTSSLSRLSLSEEEGFTANDMVREALNGDDFSAMMIARTGKFIGIAVASVINLLNIERIVLGGPIMEAGDLILKPIIEEAGKRSFQPCFEATRIVAAELGADGVAIGAALLARDTDPNIS